MCRISSCSPEVPLSFSTSAMISPPGVMEEDPSFVHPDGKPDLPQCVGPSAWPPDPRLVRAPCTAPALYTLKLTEQIRFHLPGCGSTTDDLHRPVLMSQL